MSFDLIAENKLSPNEVSKSFESRKLYEGQLVMWMNNGDLQSQTKEEHLKSLPLDDIENRISLCLNNSTYRKLMSFCEKRVENFTCVESTEDKFEICLNEVRPVFNESLYYNDGYKVSFGETHILHLKLSELLKDYKRHNWRQDKKEFELDGWTKKEWIDLIKDYSDFCERSGGYYIY